MAIRIIYIPNATTSVLASHDRINIGQEGLSGAICNIRYFKEPQSKTNRSNYNLYSVMNPQLFILNEHIFRKFRTK